MGRLFSKIKKNIILETIIFFLLIEILFLVVLPSLILGAKGLFQEDVSLFFSEKEVTFKLITPETITIYRHQTGVTETIPFEEYVKGVVAGEMPSSFHQEALKAQAVAARTYSFSKLQRSGDSGFPSVHPQAALCDDTHCQVYRSVQELEAIKGEKWIKEGWDKICKAVDSTKGQLMYYNGKLVEQPLFHSSSGGKTENSEDVFASAYPYLKSVSSPYEDGATHQNEEKSFSTKDLAYLLNLKYPKQNLATPIGNIEILSTSEGGRVEKIKINDSLYEGRQVREALGLASADFNVEHNKSNGIVTFVTDGYGHGVGMSQYGANGMAKLGYNYKEILKHYYQGISVD